MAAVIVLGSVNVDLVVRGERLPRPGETVIGGAFFQAAGGKGANQAVAAARAGLGRTALIAAVGDDEFGRAALAGFEREGIHTAHVLRIPAQPTGVALILVDQHGENLISVASGANAMLLPEHVDLIPAAFFAHAKVFLTGFESPLAAVRRGLERARAAGLRTILNPAPALPLNEMRDLLPLVDLLIPNEHEAAALTGREVDSVASAEAGARELQKLGAKEVIITLGSRGAVLVAEEALALPAFPANVVDTTAAGDAFCGAFAAAWSEGKSSAAAFRFALAAAAISVSRAGAQPSLATRDEIESLL